MLNFAIRYDMIYVVRIVYISTIFSTVILG